MSDNPAGWAAALAVPLGPDPPEELPWGVLPCLFPLRESPPEPQLVWLPEADR